MRRRFPNPLKIIKRTLILLVVAGVVFGLAGLISSWREAARQAARQAAWQQQAKAQRKADLERMAAPVVVVPSQEPARTEEPAPSAAVAPQQPPAKTSRPTGVRSQPKAPVANANRPPRPKEELKDPLARLALAFVGADLDAEAYWAVAINDPGLSANERQDLIEDLNEEGFADPRNLTADDLPLIVSRLEVIEEYAPYAMDEVNADAFMEAYKDLVNMFTRLTQR